MKLNRLLFYLFGFTIIFLQFSCDNNLAGDVSIKEVKRIRSSDRKVDAILVEADAGATTSTSSKIFIVKSGKKIAVDDFASAVFNCDNSLDVDIRWEENKSLIVSYKKARIFNYTSFWESEDIDNYRYVVNIELNRIR